MKKWSLKDEKMGKLLIVVDNASMLLVGWQERRLACRKCVPPHLCWEENRWELANPGSAGKWLIKHGLVVGSQAIARPVLNVDTAYHWAQNRQAWGMLVGMATSIAGSRMMTMMMVLVVV